MRKATITPNRFTTYIQSWWAKSAAFLILVAITISCIDETGLIGFQNSGKFQVSYVEVPLSASVFLGDSLLTNNGLFQGETNRFLVGKYTDDKLGAFEAITYTQFISTNTSALPANATLDRVVLNLNLDYYYSGDNAIAPFNFSIHELTDTLKSELYYNVNQRNYNATPVGEREIQLDPANFETLATTPGTRIDTISIDLTSDFATRLFTTMVNRTEDYTLFSKFRGIFKGFAIRSNNANKIIGINPAYDGSATSRNKTRLRVFYSYPDAITPTTIRKGVVDFSLFNAGTGVVTNFSSITSDRSGSVIQGQPVFDSFIPSDGKCYVQGGVPVYSKLDFTNYYKFLDTIPNIALNSVELVVGAVSAQTAPLPPALELRLMEEDQDKFFDLTRTRVVSGSYVGRLSSRQYNLQDTLLLPLADNNTAFSLSRKTENGTTFYTGFLTSFAKALSVAKKTDDEFVYFGLSVQNPSENKSVSRMSFAPQDVKLRIYYTKPKININP